MWLWNSRTAAGKDADGGGEADGGGDGKEEETDEDMIVGSGTCDAGAGILSG